MMMFKTISMCVICTLAAAQFAAAQGDAAEGLLNQLVTPKPAVTVPAKPVEAKAPIVGVPGLSDKPLVPAPKFPVLREPAVSAPIPAEKPAEFQPVKTVVEKPVEVQPMKAPEVNEPAMSLPVVAPKPELPASTLNTNKPTFSLVQPKKRGGGASFLNRANTATNTPQRETVITSDKIDFDNREGVILFDENVFVDDPQFSMRSDRLLIFMEGTNDVSQVMSIGNVVFSNEMRSATCNKAIYTRKDGQIVMTGDVRLKTEGETAGEVRGEKVVIWLDDERVEVLLGAKITLPPGAFKKAADSEKKEGKGDKKKDEPPQTK
jgi:lipopolysaccharide transport protein LptA